MSLVDDLHENLEKPEVIEEWRDLISGIISDSDERSKLIEWTKEYRDEFLDMASDVQQEDEIKTTLILRYIQLKAHWMTLNTQMQYQAVNTGQSDPALMAKGSLLSNLLEKLEEFIEEQEVEKISNFLTQPIAEISGDELT